MFKQLSFNFFFTINDGGCVFFSIYFLPFMIRGVEGFHIKIDCFVNALPFYFFYIKHQLSVIDVTQIEINQSVCDWKKTYVIKVTIRYEKIILWNKCFPGKNKLWGIFFQLQKKLDWFTSHSLIKVRLYELYLLVLLRCEKRNHTRTIIYIYKTVISIR